MLHATIHAAPSAVAAGPVRDLGGILVATVSLTPGAWLPLAVTFEAAAAALEGLPRMFCEPDGSFVWVSSDERGPWQLEGQLQDRGDRLDHVEIKGTCAAAPLAGFLAALRGDAERLVFQLVEEAVFIDEPSAVRLLSERD